MIRYKRLFAMLFAAVTVLNLAGCGKDKIDEPIQPDLQVESTPAPEASTPEPAPETPVPDRKLDIVILSSVGMVSPWDAYLYDPFSLLVYEKLIEKDPITGQIRGVLAQDWQMSEDGLSCSFTIREDAKFSDGTICDAEAIKEYFDYVAVIRTFENFYVSSWEAVDGKFVLHFTEAHYDTEDKLCNYAPAIGSAQAFEEHGHNSLKALIGTGPYVCTEAEEGRASFEANPEYPLGDDMPFYVNVSQLHPEDAVKALEEGRADAVYFGSSDVYRYVKTLQSGDWNGTVENIETGSVNGVWLDPLYCSAFESEKVRLAMAKLIDFEAINEELYGGSGRVATGIWAKEHKSYVQAQNIGFDPEAALALLAEAGVDPEDIEFKVYSEQGFYGCIIEQLAQAGITVTVEEPDPIFDSHLYTEDGIKIGNGLFVSPDIWTDILDESSVLYGFFGKYLQYMHTTPVMAEVKAVYEKLLGAKTMDEAMEYSRELTKLVQDECYFIGGIETVSYLAVADGADVDTVKALIVDR
ncbi:MAG: hypothetical protein IKM51_04300 [Oscillospiraceae bacterium]|nr:hypothetical protein [Oscillospiraceae bacterium]